MHGVSKRKFRAALALLMILPACSTLPDHAPPSWVDNPSAPGLWTAAAEGPTRAEAVDAAMLRLAQRVESRVRAVERFSESRGGSRLDRHATIRTDVHLLGARVLRSARRGGTHYALVGFEPDQAGRAIARRARAALDADPPRVIPGLGAQIEQGALLAPDAADWDALRRDLDTARRAAPPGSVEAPEPVTWALSERYGAALASAHWTLRSVPTYAPGEHLVMWRLEATVAGQGVQWSGLVRAASALEARRAAETDAAARVREGEEP